MVLARPNNGLIPDDRYGRSYIHRPHGYRNQEARNQSRLLARLHQNFPTPKLTQTPGRSASYRVSTRPASSLRKDTCRIRSTRIPLCNSHAPKRECSREGSATDLHLRTGSLTALRRGAFSVLESSSLHGYEGRRFLRAGIHEQDFARSGSGMLENATLFKAVCAIGRNGISGRHKDAQARHIRATDSKQRTNTFNHVVYFFFLS